MEEEIIKPEEAKEYRMVKYHSDAIWTVEEMMKSLLDVGWQLFGETTVVPRNDYVEFYQALIR